MHRRGLSFRPRSAHRAIITAAAALGAAATGVADASSTEVGSRAGAGLAGGGSPEASAAIAARAVAEACGLPSSCLRPALLPRRFAQPLRTPSGEFVLLTYQQVLNEPGLSSKLAGAGVAEAGVPVFEAEVRVLVRDEPGYPVVLERSTVRPVTGVAAPEEEWPNPPDLASRIAGLLGLDGLVVEEAVPCAWVGDAGIATPALLCIVRRGAPADEDYLRRMVVLDCSAKRGPGRNSLLECRDLICRGGGVLQVAGFVASDCLPAGVATSLEARGLAYARVSSSATGAVYADAAGRVEIAAPFPAGTVFTSTLRGRWFRVVSAESPDLMRSAILDPGGEATLVHNVGGGLADTAQVNAYVAANEARDWALSVQPDFPGLDHFEMPVNVGLASTCNAFYDGVSLNFFRAGGGCANTAYCSVVHHEYGHHLVSMAGSGQGAYGEGFGDVVAMLMRDDPGFAYGYHGDPSIPLRSGENTLMHPCTGDAHTCGMVLSGAVWETRNLLAAMDPEDYNAILSQLMLASVFMHAGSDITPQIVVDLLTLDDDDADIFNGTPHYDQIAAGFGAHGLPAPALPPVGLRFPNGLPQVVSPLGAMFHAEAVLLGDTIASVTLLLDVDGQVSEIPVEEQGDGQFIVVLPPLPCGEEIGYSFELLTDGGETVVNPMSVPPEPGRMYRAVVASAAPDVLVDDFEQDAGWSVVNTADLTDGAWQRGVPAALGDRGDPVMDYDGSGACWLTANRCCNSDVDNGATTLVSAPLDVSRALAGGAGQLGRVELAYARWFFNETTGASPDDAFLVEISGDNGQTWTVLESVGPEGPGVSGGWVRREFAVSELNGSGGGPLIRPPGLMRVRFTASDTGVGSIVEAGVDALEVRAYPCGEACVCERDGNIDQIDVFDLLRYLDDWFRAVPAADITGEGAVDVFDLLSYLDCWFAACR